MQNVAQSRAAVMGRRLASFDCPGPYHPLGPLPGDVAEIAHSSHPHDRVDERLRRLIPMNRHVMRDEQLERRRSRRHLPGGG
jgi:hypothetical protein